MRAYLNLRFTVPERRSAFTQGLERLGYKVVHGMALPKDGDILVTWNRISAGDRMAAKFQTLGCKVIVTENATWGNDFAGDRWYSLALNYHNTAGCFPIGDSERFDSLTVDLQPFRTEGETVILPQRGIGSPPTAMPRSWEREVVAKYKARVRRHPGTRPVTPLEHDLRHCARVITWGSGAAVKALMMGISVTSEMPNWIAEQDNTEEGRLAMFRRLAWAQWRLDEIASGDAFDWLLA